MERDKRVDQQQQHVEVKPQQHDEAQVRGPRFNDRGMLPQVEANVDRAQRTASEQGYDAPRVPLSIQERSGLSPHKFEVMQGTPAMEAYLAAVRAHDTATDCWGALVRDKKSSIDVEAASAAVQAAQTAELRAKTVLNGQADKLQPEVKREPELQNIDRDGKTS